MNKKIKFTLAAITILIIGVSIFIFKALVGYSEITTNKTEEIMEQQQRWVDEVISISDTTSYETKRRIDSLTRIELKLLKTPDSLLKLEIKNKKKLKQVQRDSLPKK